MDNDELPVSLNLEESGVLIHLLVRELIRSDPPSNDWGEDAVKERMEVLYQKLVTANDRLMGKRV